MRRPSAGASATARCALGFQDLLDGDVAAMKQRTRNYARRQLTWMRKLAGAHELDLTSRAPDEAAAEIERLWTRPLSAESGTKAAESADT